MNSSMDLALQHGTTDKQMYLDINAMDALTLNTLEVAPAKIYSDRMARQIGLFEGALEHIARGPRDVADKFYDTSLYVLKSLNPQHPILCFNHKNLRNQARRFRQNFPGQVTYAVKANHNNRVIDVLLEEGIKTFDVASLEEMKLVRGLHAGARFHYYNPVKSRAEISQAYDVYGVRHFALDDEGEFWKLADICDPAETTLVVRFRLNDSKAAHDFSTKFGASTDAACDLLRKAKAASFKCALTFHPGPSVMSQSPMHVTSMKQRRPPAMQTWSWSLSTWVAGFLPSMKTTICRSLRTISQSFRRLWSTIPIKAPLPSFANLTAH